MNVYKQHAYNRSVGWSTWHMQWCTKYRYKVFGRLEYKNLCTIFLYEAARRGGFSILDCEVDVDHVHVLASLPLTMTPAHAVQQLKGFTARCLFMELPHLRRIYKRRHLWGCGKFIGSVGHITLDKARNYLEAHHAKAILGNPSPGAKRRGRPKGGPLGLGGCQLFK
jgi:putative transposase